MARQASVSEECIDAITPWNVYLSAKYKRSFAYHTVRNRLPVTITQVIDHMTRNKDEIAKAYGEASREEVKQIIGYCSKFKTELQTNKPMTPFTASDLDEELWNDFLKNTEESLGRPMLWFADVWLHIECYMYRRMREAFALMQHLHDYDPFRHQKEEAFTGSIQAMSVVGNHLLKLCTPGVQLEVEKCVAQFFKLCLWGNRCDLSISGGKDIAQVENPLEMISQLDDLILVNDLQRVWAVVSSSSGPRVIDIIFDNAGYELFTDLCLAHLLITLKLADKIRFHAKRIPWFISDVMKHDFNWLIEEMGTLSDSPVLNELSRKWKDFVSSGRWSVIAEPFWTLPYSYDCMKQIDEELHSSLKESKLLIFKGDLNYRKLVGDMNWLPTERFDIAIRGFEPAPLVTLRTIKADVVVGLKPGQAEEIAKVDEDWMTTGKYAVISCHSLS